MRLVVVLVLILSACGPIPAHDGGSIRAADRGGDGNAHGASTFASPEPERVATGVIGGPVAGEVVGGEPGQGGLIGGDIGAVE